MTLEEYEQKYNDIMDSSLTVDEKNYELAKLMTDMEGDFEIPLLNNDDWNSQNNNVIELYRIISNSRNF